MVLLIRELVPNKTKDSNVDFITLEDEKTVSSSKDIANHFNEFFITIGSKLASNFQTDTSEINILPNQKDFSFSHISPTLIKKTILSLGNDKTTGLDGISFRLLKEGVDILKYKLAFLYNFSLSSGSVPKIWKRKRVSPIFKSGDTSLVGKYRPISILSNCMKVFEKLVFNFLCFLTIIMSYIKINLVFVNLSPPHHLI